jgi:hypothetical protein
VMKLRRLKNDSFGVISEDSILDSLLPPFLISMYILSLG